MNPIMTTHDSFSHTTTPSANKVVVTMITNMTDNEKKLTMLGCPAYQSKCSLCYEQTEM